MHAQSQPHRPATSRDIRDIIGSGSDALITEIMYTGASPDEILQACEWLDADDYMGEREVPMDVRAQRVYEILQRDRERFEPDER